MFTDKGWSRGEETPISAQQNVGHPGPPLASMILSRAKCSKSQIVNRWRFEIAEPNWKSLSLAAQIAEPHRAICD